MRREYLEQDGNLIDLTYTDPEVNASIARECEYLRETGQIGNSDVRHFAKVPAEYVEKFLLEAGTTFKEFTRNPALKAKFLNSPDVAPFRVWQGRV